LNYDRDDSLNDVISFGKQTPFRFEYGSQLIDEVEEEEEQVDDDWVYDVDEADENVPIEPRRGTTSTRGINK
jgi:hypothetical protein